MSPAHRSGAACSAGYSVRNPEAEALVGDRPLGEAPVDVAAGEARASGRGSRGRCVQYAHSPHVHASHGTPTIRPVGRLADDLVAEHARQLRDIDLAIDEVQVRAAHPARQDAHSSCPRRASGAGRSTNRSGSPTRSRTMARIGG